MLTLPASVRIFVARGATDLRRSFDRLSAQVREVLRQDPLSGHVFVFFNRQRNRERSGGAPNRHPVCADPDLQAPAGQSVVYLRDVIERVSTHPARLVLELTPRQWKRLRHDSRARAAA